MAPNRTPPRGLSVEAKSLWRRINAGWSLDDSGATLLSTALESFDEMRTAQNLIKQHGAVFKTETGQIKKNPAFEILRVARAQFLQSWSMLGLDLPAPPEKPKTEFGG